MYKLPPFFPMSQSGRCTKLFVTSQSRRCTKLFVTSQSRRCTKLFVTFVCLTDLLEKRGRSLYIACTLKKQGFVRCRKRPANAQFVVHVQAELGYYHDVIFCQYSCVGSGWEIGKYSCSKHVTV